MQLSTRVEDGRQVRVIVWNPTTTSDLSAVVAPVVLAVVLAGFIVAAVETAGWVRILCVVLAVVAGVYWALIAGTLGVIALGIYVGKGLLAETPTRAQQAAFAVPPIILGAVVGVGPYESGPTALLAGPIVAAIIIALVWQKTASRRIRTRSAVLSCLGAAVAIAVGCTIFL